MSFIIISSIVLVVVAYRPERRARSFAMSRRAARALASLRVRPWVGGVARRRHVSSSVGAASVSPDDVTGGAVFCPVRSRYDDLVLRGRLRPDPAQAAVVDALGDLRARLRAHRASLAGFFVELDAHVARRRALEADVASRERDAEDARERARDDHDADPNVARADAALLVARDALAALPPAPVVPEPPRGVYLHGDVGVGKTLLMDLFFDTLDESVVRHRRRVHFNAAMLELHQRMHELERENAEPPGTGTGTGTGTGSGTDASGDASVVASAGAGGFLNPAAFAKSLLLAVRRRRRLRNLAAARESDDESDQSNDASDEKSLSDTSSRRWGAHTNAAVLRRAAREMLGDSASRDGGFALLAFDEFQIVDAFACVALKGVFEELLRAGATIVVTSNRSVDGLNSDGLQAELFESFAAALRTRCSEIKLDGAGDYRRVAAANDAERAVRRDGNGKEKDETHAGVGPHATTGAYFWPLDSRVAAAGFESRWRSVVGDAEASPRTIETAFARRLTAPLAVDRVARFTFEELCARPLGVADYVALTETYDAIFVSDVPKMSAATRDRARRFITLVDEAYNRGVALVLAADAPPDGLFAGDADEGADEGAEALLEALEGLQFEGESERARSRRDVTRDAGVAPVATTERGMRGASARTGGVEERFAFARAASRLLEMQTEAYAREKRR